MISSLGLKPRDGKKIYKPRPVFKIKIKPPAPGETSATLDKFKFRQTIAAFANTMSLKKGVDFEEKRASTVRWESTLTLIALAVEHDLDIAAIDIKTFFLYGNLPDDVYMEQPPEWEEASFPAAARIMFANFGSRCMACRRPPIVPKGL